MATWPSGTKASTTNLDAGTDKPSLARGDLKTNVDNVNAIIDTFNISSPTNNDVLKYNSSTAQFDAVAQSTLVAGSATSATTATNANNINIATTDGNTSDTTMSVVLVGAQSTGNQAPHIDGGLTYNASTNTLTVATSGAHNGSVGATTPSTGIFTTLKATGATGGSGNKLTIDGTAISLTNSFWGGGSYGAGINQLPATYTNTSSTGTLAQQHIDYIAAQTMASSSATTITDAATVYIAGNPTAGLNTTITNGWALLTAGDIKANSFTGSLIGNADTATTATTATGATNVNIATTTGNTSDTLTYIPMTANLATGNQQLHLDSSLSYNASTGALTATSFSGAHNGTVGATTPSTGAFTSITASTTITGTGVITANGGLTANSSVASTPKLTIGTTALSSTAWTTSGIGIRASAATYTDTSSLAGTIAASHIHAIAAPTMASTNAITVTDAATLYVATRPTAGTNTTITNGWAILTAGNIKANQYTGSGAGLTSIPNSALTNSSITINGTAISLGGTVSTGTVTSVSGTGTVNGLSLSGTVTSTGNLTLSGTLDLTTAPAIGSTTASTGAFTTLSATTTGTSGALSVTYNPTSASGAAINATGKDSQGGTGYFDFLKITNTTTGATNANKTFRTNSTGQLEIINSAYNGVILALTDAGNLQAQSLTVNKDIRETNYALTYAATITPDCANGTIQTVTLTGNVTFSAFSNPVAGQSMTLIVKQDATGGRTLTSTMKFSGGSKTLSTAANSIDIISVFYDGTNYYASLGKGFA